MSITEKTGWIIYHFLSLLVKQTMESLTRKYCCDSVIQIENFKCVSCNLKEKRITVIKEYLSRKKWWKYKLLCNVNKERAQACIM